MAFSILAWMPATLMRSLEITESQAGLVMGIIGLTAIAGALWGGWLADWWHKRNRRGRMLLAAVAEPSSAVLAIVALLLLKMNEGPASLTNPFLVVASAAGVLYGIINIIGIPALGAVTQDVVHPRLKGASWGMAMFSMYMLGGAWGPLLVGALSDWWGGNAAALQAALIVTSSAGFLAGLCFWNSSRYYFKDAAKAAEQILTTDP
jgi:MFS family permease